MDFKNKVSHLLEEALREREDLFLLNLEVSDSFKISVTIDGDQGVTLQDCIDISRAIEHNLDKEAYDFSIDVLSAGISSPLKLIRQYKKNIGRKLNIKSQNNTFEGDLIAADDEGVILEWKSREAKPTGKGKVTVLKTQKINYLDINEAVVVLTF